MPISVICFEVFSNAWTGLPVIAGYLITLVAAYAVFKWAERRHYHRKYLDYRALAEGLRVQFFWKMAGMNEPVAKYYLIRQESELDWIRHALRTLDFVGSIHSTVHPSSKLSVIKQSWVDAQTKYYERALLRDYHKLSSLQKKNQASGPGGYVGVSMYTGSHVQYFCCGGRVELLHAKNAV